MAGVCRAETDTDVKCAPHKFYEMAKYSLHHLPTIWPEGYTDAQILEGDGTCEGDLRLWTYILPGKRVLNGFHLTGIVHRIGIPFHVLYHVFI
ncbi:hypothetical protein AQUCO_02600252v1 [Aquilegia coerulea]|uniref:Bet v I/Major latex protein domain-containing protein n=1 Tax=Aquilegia coerulea TaxID=218851 RepID=A0A2G5D832_AQUCA|nr:hypothetical protein AQUCO_02600252v1 [Aquilegia coerulea]